MSPLREGLSPHAGMSSAARLGLLFAAIAALCLLSIFINLLHEQVARGEQLRQTQRGASDRAATPVAVLPKSLTLTQQGDMPGSADNPAR